MNEQGNIFVVRGTEGNAPTQLKGMQIPLAPHLDALIALWWVVFAGTLVVVVIKGWALRER